MEEKRADESKLDSHKVNLSITYANAFINAGFSTDTIMMKEGEDQDWIYKNKDSGQTSKSRRTTAPEITTNRYINLQEDGSILP